MNYTHKFNISVILTVFLSMPAFGASSTIHFHAPESGTIENLATKEKTNIVKDTDLALKIDAPMMVRLDGRIAVLVVPAQGGDSVVKLNPPLERDIVEKASQKEIGNSVSEIMIAMDAIHKSIQKKNYDQASTQIDELQNRFPQVGFLNFARASIYLLQGEKNKARETVTRALQSYPDYKEGQEFLKALTGNNKTGGKDE